MILLDKRIEEMLARGRKLRCLWVYGPNFSRILWELQKKTRQFHSQVKHFGCIMDQ